MFIRKLEVGDSIVCKGIKAEIGEILFQDAYISKDVPEDRKYIDIEFKDTRGKYRHWKSHLDGGSVQYKEKSGGKYYLKCYRTHEDEQYGHSDYLSKEEYSSAEIAEKKLKSLYEPRRHYQVMVVDDKGRLVTAIRSSKIYRFIYESDLAKLIKRLSEDLVKVASKSRDIEKGSYRCELYEDMGFIDLKICGNSQPYVFTDILGDKWNGVFDEVVTDLIKATNRLVGKPIKSYKWCTWYDFSRCHYTKSMSESGSVILYFDFF